MKDHRIGLSMIVKNEAHNLPRLAESVREQIDYWVIVDTGSTDGTPELVHELFGHLPGKMLLQEFTDFSTSRNLALDVVVPHCGWVLRLDADETFEGSVPLDIPQKYNCVELAYDDGGLLTWLPRLLRANAGWRWRGRTHEYSDRDGPTKTLRTSQARIVHHSPRHTRGEKYPRDVALLQMDYADDPTSLRTMFYLAQTYDDMGDSALALKWYERCLTHGGPDEWIWTAAWRRGATLVRLGRHKEGMEALMEAWITRTWRPEPLVILRECYTQLGQGAMVLAIESTAMKYCQQGPDADRLYIDANAYRWVHDLWTG